ncbi:LysO family transporter [Marinifilum sp. D737]|uniref:LysO family transporter n=1 Tax=Marinifilum sp. D737 TaxID=2969628 RepID=UPI002274A2E8|nr:LysO family transporter [Marinifilum sp. D737]MCY1635188.1 lysine exporter LysO family protein [Marinifilum sp. D737]
MITVLVLMTLGIGLGFFVGKFPKVIKGVDKMTTWSIYLLLFLLGIGVGLNEKIINNLHTIGLQALILTIGAILGSLIFAYITYKLFFKSK